MDVHETDARLREIFKRNAPSFDGTPLPLSPGYDARSTWAVPSHPRHPKALVVAFVFLLLATGLGTDIYEAVTHLAKRTTTIVIFDKTAPIPGAVKVQVVTDIPYVTRPGGSVPGLVDVIAPKQAGPWPVVVMLHESAQTKSGGCSGWAARVAQHGAVVFVPEWDRGLEPSLFMWTTPEELRAVMAGEVGDVAAAVRFARANAARYGGDPENITLFGHGAGAMLAVVEALSGASASEGALGGEGSTLPDSLVIFEPDYLLLPYPPWDEVVARDPGVMALQTPWTHLGHRVDFPITVIGSGDLTLFKEIGDPWAEDSWLAVRDPSGDIRRGLEAIGAFSDDRVTNEEVERLFVERLEADGDAVTYIRLSRSTHEEVVPADFEIFLDALVPETQP